MARTGLCMSARLEYLGPIVAALFNLKGFFLRFFSSYVSFDLQVCMWEEQELNSIKYHAEDLEIYSDPSFL